jgi:hypothetical protein
VIFNVHEIPKHPGMMIVNSGTLAYDYVQRGVTKRSTVGAGGWMCEACLWLGWVHCGTLSATVHTQIFKLNALDFGRVVTSFVHQDVDPYEYAHDFYDAAVSLDPDDVTDLPLPHQLAVCKGIPDDDPSRQGHETVKKTSRKMSRFSVARQSLGQRLSGSRLSGFNQGILKRDEAHDPEPGIPSQNLEVAKARMMCSKGTATGPVLADTADTSRHDDHGSLPPLQPFASPGGHPFLLGIDEALSDHDDLRLPESCRPDNFKQHRHIAEANNGQEASLESNRLAEEDL